MEDAAGGNQSGQSAVPGGCEQYVSLIDYFMVMWKHKVLILLGTVLPTLVFGAILLLLPRNYEATYVYQLDETDGEADLKADIGSWNLDAVQYEILLSSFYGMENAKKVSKRLREKDLVEHAEKIERDSLRCYAVTEVSPGLDIQSMVIINPDSEEQLRVQKASLLKMTICVNSRKDFAQIASTIRENFEGEVPLYMIGIRLDSYVRELKVRMSEIETGRFGRKAELDMNKAILEQLKQFEDTEGNVDATGISMQFDISEETEFVPIEYRINAARSQVIAGEEQIAAGEASYIHYGDMLVLAEELLAEIDSSLAAGSYKLEDFRVFLRGLSESREDMKMSDYLNSYVREIENRISSSSPVTESPGIEPVARGAGKYCIVVFAAMLVLSVFCAFVVEQLKARA